MSDVNVTTAVVVAWQALNVGIRTPDTKVHYYAMDSNEEAKQVAYYIMNLVARRKSADRYIHEGKMQRFMVLGDWRVDHIMWCGVYVSIHTWSHCLTMRYESHAQAQAMHDCLRANTMTLEELRKAARSADSRPFMPEPPVTVDMVRKIVAQRRALREVRFGAASV